MYTFIGHEDDFVQCAIFDRKPMHIIENQSYYIIMLWLLLSFEFVVVCM